MKKLLYFILIVLTFGLVTFLILKNEPEPSFNPERNFIEGQEEIILTKFLTAKDSTIIELDEGHFKLSQSLSLNGLNHVTIRGKGIDKTVLSFKGQTKGAEGILISNCKNITLENLTVEDAKGDNVKFMECDSIIIRKVQANWTGKVSKFNGAYALYPVMCNNVLIDSCRAIGSSDVGIYVGQSNNVVVSNSEAFYNVGGIENENTQNMKIFNNDVHDNVAGILVFDLPGLTNNTKNVEVYNNKVYNNNIRSFAPKGTIAGQVPTGCGSVIVGSEDVHFYDNEFTDNKTGGIFLVSYESIYQAGKISEAEEKDEDGTHNIGNLENLNNEYKTDEKFQPYSRNIKFSLNQFSNKHWFPTINNVFGIIMLTKSPFKYNNLVWDGAIGPNQKSSDEVFCITENAAKNTSFISLDILNDFKKLTRDVSQYVCK